MAGTNSRFATAIHIAAMLAVHPGEPLTSRYVADSVNTNPVVIRRLMAALKTAGLLTSQPGVRGGFLLSRPAETVSLGQVFRAVEDCEGTLFRVHVGPNDRCPFGEAIGRLMCQVSRDAEQAMLAALDRRSVAEISTLVTTGAV